MIRNQGFGMWGWNSEVYVVFAHPLPSIPTHVQPTLIRNPTGRAGIHVTREGVGGMDPLDPNHRNLFRYDL